MVGCRHSPVELGAATAGGDLLPRARRTQLRLSNSAPRAADLHLCRNGRQAVTQGSTAERHMGFEGWWGKAGLAPRVCVPGPGAGGERPASEKGPGEGND